MKLFALFLTTSTIVILSECKIIAPAPFAECERDSDCMDVCLSNDLPTAFNCIKNLGICLCSTKYDEKESVFCFRSNAPNSISEKCYKDCNSIMAHAGSTEPHVCLSDGNTDNYFYRCTCFAKL